MVAEAVKRVLKDLLGTMVKAGDVSRAQPHVDSVAAMLDRSFSTSVRRRALEVLAGAGASVHTTPHHD